MKDSNIQTQNPAAESEDRFRQIVEGLPQIIYELDLEGHFTYVNEFALSEFGFTRKDFKNGIHFHEILHPNSLKKAQDNIAATLSGKKTKGQEYVGVCKDGTTIPVQIYSQAIVEDDTPIGIRGVVINLTKIREAEEAIRKSENYYRTLFENTGTAMFIVDANTVIRSCNSQVEELSGYKAEELEGKVQWPDLVAPEDIDRLYYYNQKRIQDGEAPKDYVFTFLARGNIRKKVRAFAQIIPGTADTACSFIDITEQELTNEALRESQERYEQVVRGANDGIWDWDIETNEVYYSPRYKEIIGYEDHELPNIAESWKNRVHPDDMDHVIAANMECVEGKVNNFEVEYRFRHKDGTYRWVHGRGASVRNTDGKVYRLAGTHTDITKRKQTEQALMNSERRLRNIFTNASDGVYRCTPEGAILTANPSMATILGYDSPAHLISSISNIGEQAYIDPSERHYFLKALIKEGHLAHYETQLQRKDGTRIWVSENIRATYDHEGKLAYYDGFLQDITARKNSERTTQAMYAISKAIATANDLQELYETIHAILGEVIDTTNFFISLHDEKEDLLSFEYFEDEMDDYYDITNVSAPDTKGLTVHVLRTGKPLLLSTAFPMDKEARKTIREVGTPSAVWLGVPLIVRDKTIGAMAIQHYSNPHHYSRTDVAFMEAVSEQVALAIERKTNEEELTILNESLETTVTNRTAELRDKADELETANKRLTELDHIKSALVSSVSHELRTPLTSIRGFAKLTGKDFIRYFQPLAEDDQETKKGKRISRNLKIIETEGERLTRLINDFLDINRIESGKTIWNDSFINPCEVIRQAVNTVAGAFTALPNVELITELPKTVPPIHADPDKVQQILINLLNNASKFTIQGEVRVSVTSYKETLTVAVADTGMGIDKNEQANIFRKFHKSRQGDTISIKDKGTGLGLAICKEIVEHYGGSIWVESEKGLGSVFSFTLPAVSGSETSC